MLQPDVEMGYMFYRHQVVKNMNAGMTNYNKSAEFDGVTHTWDIVQNELHCCGVEACIARQLSYAPYADMLWWETSKPDLDEARQFAEAIHDKFPGKLLAYNCSPSFNWSNNLSSRSYHHVVTN